MTDKQLKPLFKYPGGKQSEYKYLKKFFPNFETYVEPFLGGGAVYWAVDANKWIINDFSTELVNIYEYTAQKNLRFISILENISDVWEMKQSLILEVAKNLEETLETGEPILTASFEAVFSEDNVVTIDMYRKLDIQLNKAFLLKIASLKRVGKSKKIENLTENAHGILGASVYGVCRDLYNGTALSVDPELKTALYYFLREYAYAGMFRYNASGGFNVPFGGNTYANKMFSNRIAQLKNHDVLNKLQSTDIVNGDFSEVLIDKEDTFIFLDPPYDTEFSSYNDHVFDIKEQVRLKEKLQTLSKSKWLMVTKSTPFIDDLYSDEMFHKHRFDKKYSVNIQNRNSQDVEHLVITNYEL